MKRSRCTRIKPTICNHYPVISLACSACVVFIAITTFAPVPYGLLERSTNVDNSTSYYLVSCDPPIRPNPTVCASDWYSFLLLAISRCSAYFIYPLILSLFLTKLNHLRTLLQRSWLSMYVPFHDLHALHVIAGSVVGIDALVHSFCHLLRWALQGRISLLWSTYTGLSGLLVCTLTPLIYAPMKYDRLKRCMSWELRKALHYLAIVWGIALCFHAPQQQIAILVGVPVGLYLLDYAAGSMLRTYLVESPILTKMENGVDLTFAHPDGFSGRSGYVYVCLPWVSRLEWHAFSLFQHPTLPNHSSVCMNVNGDWTRAVHEAVRSRTVRPVWVSGPFASPYSTAVSYEDLILVASGIGITPAMDIINAYRSGNRRLSLIWTCRDASLLEYYLTHGHFDKDGWTLIYYTGKRKLVLDSLQLPETLCIFYGRPCWDVVVREIITSIELGVGLPEQVIAETKACMDDILQVKQQLAREGISTPFERFKRLFQRILCRQSASDLYVEMQHFAQRHGTLSKKGDAIDFDVKAFSHLVHHLMPHEFTDDETNDLFENHFAAARQSARLSQMPGRPPPQVGLQQFKEFIDTVANSLLIDQGEIGSRLKQTRGSYTAPVALAAAPTVGSSAGQLEPIVSFLWPEGDDGIDDESGESDDEGAPPPAGPAAAQIRIQLDHTTAPPPPPPPLSTPPMTPLAPSNVVTKVAEESEPKVAEERASAAPAANAAAAKRPPLSAFAGPSSASQRRQLIMGNHEPLRTAPRPGKHVEIERTFTHTRSRKGSMLLRKNRQLKVFGGKEHAQSVANMQRAELEQIGEVGLAKWQILYCGGSQPVVDALSKISDELGVDFRMEKFDW